MSLMLLVSVLHDVSECGDGRHCENNDTNSYHQTLPIDLTTLFVELSVRHERTDFVWVVVY
jgi:hypothetical protein